MARSRNVGRGESVPRGRREAASGGPGRGPERTTERIKPQAKGMGERVKSRASEMAETRKRQAADRVHEAGERLEARGESLEAQGGVKGRAGRAVHRAGDTLERGADYLETHRLSTIRDDAKHQIVEHPFVTVGAALGTGFTLGWLVGKVGESDEEAEFERRERFVRDGVSGGGEERGRGMMGRAGQALMTGLTAMAARGIRDRLAGTRHRA